jgi:hypothetical protein
MKSTDKFLIWLVVGVLALVGIALAVLLTLPDPVYLAEDDPVGVVNNYILAIHKEDFDRAYSYLDPSLPGYPQDVLDFQNDLQEYGVTLGEDSSITIGDVSVVGDHAQVQVHNELLGEQDLFLLGRTGFYDWDFTVDLVSTADGWKITDAWRYFAFCWASEEGCK